MFTRSTMARTGLALLALGAASMAPAQQAPVVVNAPAVGEQSFTQRVSFADLNLASASDQKLLRRRVSLASRQVCRPNAFDDVLTAEENTGCVFNALQGARPQVSQAIARATELAMTGTSTMPAVAIAVSAGL